MSFLLEPVCMVIGHRWGRWKRTALTKTRYCQRCHREDHRIDRESMDMLRDAARSARDPDHA